MKVDKDFIKKAVIVNSLLIVYFCCSNLSSFIGIVLGVGMFTTAGVTCFFCEGENKQLSEEKPNEWTLSADLVQKKYDEFIHSSLGKRKYFLTSELITLISLYILTKISWYLPTWLLLFVIGETFVFWDLLKEKAVFEKIDNLVRLSKESIEKFTGLIPKYEAQANN